MKIDVGVPVIVPPVSAIPGWVARASATVYICSVASVSPETTETDGATLSSAISVREATTTIGGSCVTFSAFAAFDDAGASSARRLGSATTQATAGIKAPQARRKLMERHAGRQFPTAVESLFDFILYA